MSLIDDIKAAERAELDRAIDKHEREFEAFASRHCPWCRFTFSTVYGTRARRISWIPEAGVWGHLRCWQRKQEEMAQSENPALPR